MKSTPFWVGKFGSREAMEAAFHDAELDRLDAEREAEADEAPDPEDEEDKYWEDLMYSEAPDGAW